MSSRAITSRQSVACSSQPSREAASATADSSRPTTTRRAVRGTSKAAPTVRQAWEGARPTRAWPVMARRRGRAGGGEMGGAPGRGVGTPREGVADHGDAERTVGGQGHGELLRQGTADQGVMGSEGSGSQGGGQRVEVHRQLLGGRDRGGQLDRSVGGGGLVE